MLSLLRALKAAERFCLATIEATCFLCVSFGWRTFYFQEDKTTMNPKKQSFEIPKAEIVIFSSDDVITTSPPVYEGGNIGEWDPQSPES